MTIDNEIRIGKNNKKLLEESAQILETIDALKTDSKEATFLNIKHSENGELLREFDYNSAISRWAKRDFESIEEAAELSFLVPSVTPDEVFTESSKKFFALARLRYTINENLSAFEKGNLDGLKDLSLAYTVLKNK